MTVAELIDALQEFDPDVKVRLATQPSYPLMAGAGWPVEVDGVVYVPEAGSQDYLPGAAAEEIGWGR